MNYKYLKKRNENKNSLQSLTYTDTFIRNVQSRIDSLPMNKRTPRLYL